MNLASSGLYDALKHIVSKARGTSTKVTISLRKEASGDVLVESEIETNDPNALQKIPQVLQQASDTVRQLSDDD